MTATLAVTLDDDSRARADHILGQLADRAENVEGGLRNIGEALLKTTDERFANQQDPQGNAWVPLRPLTVDIRGSSGPILTVSGRLRKSVSYEVSGGTLRLGPNAVGDAVQQFGATIVPRNASALRIPLPVGTGGRNAASAVFSLRVVVPPRPYIGFGPKDEEAAREAVEEWLEVEAGGAE
ncbi:phage virion morphogenesis protein [Xanthobacter sp. VTT E-85241]|uniref:phage virion morphogenesis protein n=1 Tax=Roseixanthobacter finlandensis TaxID=3119922 RepID=UPI00372BA6C0